jgi:hypothetical protein
MASKAAAGGGFEAWFNAKFPEQYHKVWAMFGLYFGVYASFKVLSSGGSKKHTPHVDAHAATSHSTHDQGGFQLPTAENLGTWLDNADNVKQLEKFFESEENIKKFESSFQ